MQLSHPSGKNPSNPASKSVTDCIRAEWSNLTEEEIGYAARDRQRFFEAVNRKYSLTRDEVEKQLRQWERECREAA